MFKRFIILSNVFLDVLTLIGGRGDTGERDTLSEVEGGILGDFGLDILFRLSCLLEVDAYFARDELLSVVSLPSLMILSL